MTISSPSSSSRSSTPIVFADRACLAAVSSRCLVALNRLRVDRTAPYIFLGIALWVFVLKSGVHATLAGVALACSFRLSAKTARLIEALEEGLHPYVKFLILPLFAFVNAGVPLAGLSLDSSSSVPLGIAAGLVAGKPLGIMLAVFACVAWPGEIARAGDWRAYAGVSALPASASP